MAQVCVKTLKKYFSKMAKKRMFSARMIHISRKLGAYYIWPERSHQGGYT